MTTEPIRYYNNVTDIRRALKRIQRELLSETKLLKGKNSYKIVAAVAEKATTKTALRIKARTADLYSLSMRSQAITRLKLNAQTIDYLKQLINSEYPADDLIVNKAKSDISHLSAELANTINLLIKDQRLLVDASVPQDIKQTMQDTSSYLTHLIKNNTIKATLGKFSMLVSHVPDKSTCYHLYFCLNNLFDNTGFEHSEFYFVLSYIGNEIYLTDLNQFKAPEDFTPAYKVEKQAINAKVLEILKQQNFLTATKQD